MTSHSGLHKRGASGQIIPSKHNFPVKLRDYHSGKQVERLLPIVGPATAPNHPRSPLSLTADQILALAPDASSAKAGSQLSTAAKWGNLGRMDGAIWGECQGSGKDPYRTGIDLTEPAFKCSCPSRKFPCKHGLGLYLLLAAKPALFLDAAAPAWLDDWLGARQKRSEKKTQSLEQATPEQLAASAAQARKREDKRDAKVARGLAELQTWLQDLAREGFAVLPARGPAPWEAMAARLVDAQAGALATRLRRAGTLCYQQDARDWPTALARELAAMYLITRAGANLDTLSAPLRQDLRAAIGYVTAQEEVLAGAPLADTWQVLAQHVRDDGRVRTRTSWLRGVGTGRWAQLLHFAVGTQGYDTPLLCGHQFDADLHFYQGAWPLRALIGQRHSAAQPIAALPDAPDFGDALEQHADALAANPFIERIALLVHGAQVGGTAGATTLVQGGRALPVHPAFRHHWPWLAVSGAHPVGVIGEWDGHALLPLSVWADGQLHNFDSDFAQ